MEPTTRIVIIGGGLGGLTLARILQRHQLDVIVYERENSDQTRDQGGTLDLHPEGGQYALHTAGLFEAFQALARPEGQDTRILDKNGVVYLDEITADADISLGRPEVDRGALRSLLLESLQPETVRWGHVLRGAVRQPDGRIALKFDNGFNDIADVVIGADGAWSHVRPLLTEVVPTYTGMSFVEVGLPNATRDTPDVSRLVGRGSMMALSDGKGIIAQRNASDYIRVYIGLQAPESWIVDSGIPFDRPAEARARLLNMFSDWVPALTDLIRYCADKFVPRQIFMLPIDHEWSRQPNVTLIGDAAHLMSPFAGEGANLAMRDAADLAEALHTQPTVAEAIAHYEAIMFPRAHASAFESATNLDSAMAADAPQGMLAAMLAHQPEPINDQPEEGS